ncbi:MAG: GNAT family N-acetyltransferase, partial [Cyanobacteria bacterium P01_C01_bin.70]
PNFPGRCRHIGNAGFIVAPEMRGQGLGRWMGETMLALARDRGYRAVMYNLVFETNLPSLKLWESLGFREIGRVPQGVELPGGHYVDAVMLYKSLVSNQA